MRSWWLALSALLACEARAEPTWHLIPGSFAPGRQPDGNSVIIDAPKGLIVVDTGRHREQQDKIIAYARERGKPVAAIVNTHWHLDHSGGNAELRAAFPGVPIYASRAIDGALAGFLRASRADAEAYLKSGQASPRQAEDIRGDFAAMDDPGSLRPSVAVTASGPVTIAGRALTVHLAPYAATEGDVWIYDPADAVAIVGDLVVAEVPFMDTACSEGWRTALDAIAAAPFRTLIPGHGEPMDRAAFTIWRSAFNALLDCAASSATREACIAGWRRDAARFIAPGREKAVDFMVGYYLDSRLRAPEAERRRYCPPE